MSPESSRGVRFFQDVLPTPPRPSRRWGAGAALVVLAAVLGIATPEDARAQGGAPPGPPQNFTATAGDTQVVLTWDAPADEGGTPITAYQYRVAVGATVLDSHSWIHLPGADRREATQPGLTNGTQYAFEVRALNSSGTDAGPVAGSVATATATPVADVTLTWDAREAGLEPSFTVTITFLEAVEGFTLSDISVNGIHISDPPEPDLFQWELPTENFQTISATTYSVKVTPVPYTSSSPYWPQRVRVIIPANAAQAANGETPKRGTPKRRTAVDISLTPQVNICDRTAQVEEKILSLLTLTDCTSVPSDRLASITTLDFVDVSVNSLQAGDFDWLSGLRTLNLIRVGLTTLPAGVFAKLSSLTTLSLTGNMLTALPAGVFAGLSSLTELKLDEPYSPYIVRPQILASLNSLNLESSYTPPAVPGAPTGLTATFTDTDSTITLSWTAPTGGESPTSYQILREADQAAQEVYVEDTYYICTDLVDLTTCAMAATTYIDTTVARDVTYTYEVAALNAGGKGDKSSPATVITSPTTRPPPVVSTRTPVSGGGGSPSQDEHGNTPAQATLVTLDPTRPSSTVGQLNPAADVDYFSVDVPHAGVVVVETSGPTATMGTVWQDGEELATAARGGAGRNFRLSVRVAPGSVVIAVAGNGQQTGAYTLQVTFLPGFLENPGAASFQSGIGVISGWVCEAEEVEITLNGEPQEAAYGTARLDTAGVCGDSDNGFGLLFNWNLLGDGEHEVVALVDGVELDRATVTVTTLGTEFLRDVTGRCTAADFPTIDETVTLAWQQTQQNFVLVDGMPPTGENQAGTPGVGYLENPGPNSFQSGIGVLSGWVCEGDEVIIELNGEPQPAGYGTERLDTEEACGDTANGFGLLFNWNLLGEGAHEVVAFVDGEELGRATVRVTTLGEEFLRGAEGECTVEDFPMLGETVTLEWQQNSQNFVITDVE